MLSEQIGLRVSDHVYKIEDIYISLSEFRSRCSEKLEILGDLAMNAKEYDMAILQYTIALSLNPAILWNLLGKRSEAHAGKGEWDDALGDANEVARFISFKCSNANVLLR